MTKYFLGVMSLAVVAGGCSSNNKQAGAPPLRPSVVDIAPTPPVYTTPVQPIQPVQPIAAEPAAPASFGGTAATGGSYTIQKGDTLYKIARERYGDPKQWQKIAAANPGLSPSALKVGQKITVP